MAIGQNSDEHDEDERSEDERVRDASVAGGGSRDECSRPRSAVTDRPRSLCVPWTVRLSPSASAPRNRHVPRRSRPVLEAAAEQLAAYFAGELREFDLPLRPAAHRSSWPCGRLLRRIPYGETVSYGELARRLGRPGAARAIGRANALNPLPIIVPCHRVIGADGTLTGYAGGLSVKRALLDLEAAASRT